MPSALAVVPECAPELPAPQRPQRSLARLLRRAGSGLVQAADWCLGLACLVAFGAVLVVVPVVQFVVLGYLLAASGRVARTGRLRTALVGVRVASRLGRVAVLVGLTLIPARLCQSLAASAQVIDPGGPVARRWYLAALVVLGLSAGQVGIACARGGRLRHFLWPPGNLLWLLRCRRDGAARYLAARDATCRWVSQLDLPGYWLLGLMGFAGTMVWLALPFGLLLLGRTATGWGLLGGVGLGLVAPAVAFLQVHLAAEGRFSAIFEVRAVRERSRRAPWAFALAFLALVLASVPLNLLKVELVPPEVAGLESVAFLITLGPARILCGWAYARGGQREARRAWWSRVIGRIGLTATSAAYVLVVIGTQYTSWNGIWGVIDQHAFLLPTPTFHP